MNRQTTTKPSNVGEIEPDLPKKKRFHCLKVSNQAIQNFKENIRGEKRKIPSHEAARKIIRSSVEKGRLCFTEGHKKVIRFKTEFGQFIFIQENDVIVNAIPEGRAPKKYRNLKGG